VVDISTSLKYLPLSPGSAFKFFISHAFVPPVRVMWLKAVLVWNSAGVLFDGHEIKKEDVRKAERDIECCLKNEHTL